MKIAIVHEFLNQFGGAERLLEIFMSLYPSSSIYTFFYDKKKIALNSRWKIKTSFMQFLPKLNNYKFYLPIFPLATRSFKLKNYDIILSSSHAFAKNISKPKKSLHICYCHSPMRYAWGLKYTYINYENILFQLFLLPFLTFLAWWDKKNTKNVDYFIANSKNVRNRIYQIYGRDSIVIYPPVDSKKFVIGKRKEDFYLVVSRLVKAKRIDLIIRAFNKLGRKLIIIGSGMEENSLKNISGKNITFLRYIDDSLLIDYYQRAKAIIIPGIEDFGMTSLEAQACGTPVIAYGKGGVLESVIEGKTGHFFYEQTSEALAKAVLEVECMKFSPKACRKNALRFDTEVFKRKIRRFIAEKYAEFQRCRTSLS